MKKVLTYLLIVAALVSVGYAFHTGRVTLTNVNESLVTVGEYLLTSLSYLVALYSFYWQGFVYLWRWLWPAIYWILVIGALGGGAFGLFLAVMHIGHVINFIIEVVRSVRYCVPMSVGAVCALFSVPFVATKTFISWAERNGRSGIQSYYLEASYKLFRKTWSSNRIGWKLKSIISVVNLLAVLLAVPAIIIASVMIAIVYGAFKAVTHESGLWFHPDFIAEPWKVLVSDYDAWWFNVMINKFDKHGEPLKEDEFKFDIGFIALAESIILAPIAMILTSVLGTLITLAMTPFILARVFKSMVLDEKLAGNWRSIKYLIGSIAMAIAGWAALLGLYAYSNNLDYLIVIKNVLNFATGSWFNIIIAAVVSYILLVITNVIGNGLSDNAKDVDRLEAAWEVSFRSTACSLIWVGILIVVGVVPITSILVGLIGGLIFGYAIGLPRAIKLNLDALAHYFKQLQYAADLREKHPEKPESFNITPVFVKRFAKQLLKYNNIKATDEQIEKLVENLDLD